MKKTFLTMAAVVGVIAAAQAHAATVDVQLTGPGVSGALVLTYGAATDAKYPNAYEVTGTQWQLFRYQQWPQHRQRASRPIVAVTHSVPESTNLLAPNDFSRFPVASGLSAQNNGFLTYDNLFWPGGSPQTASDYPPHGGFLDIYGLMFNIGGGRWLISGATANPADTSGLRRRGRQTRPGFGLCRGRYDSRCDGVDSRTGGVDDDASRLRGHRLRGVSPGKTKLRCVRRLADGDLPMRDTGHSVVLAIDGESLGQGWSGLG